jgi:hypothetical protein
VSTEAWLQTLPGQICLVVAIAGVLLAAVLAWVGLSETERTK